MLACSSVTASSRTEIAVSAVGGTVQPESPIPVRFFMARSSMPLLWIFLTMAMCSVATAQDHRPEVVVIRGSAGYWPGASAFAMDLSDHGFAPKMILGEFYAAHAPRIANEYHSGMRNGPITIVGYSSGADYACRLCGSLEARGVPVATLVLVESTFGTNVPANVGLCVNMYTSRPATDWIPAFRGIPVQAVSPQTEVINLDANAEEELRWMTAYNHFTVASHSDTHVMLRNLLLLRQTQYQDEQMQAARSQSQALPLQAATGLPATTPVQVRRESALPVSYRAIPTAPSYGAIPTTTSNGAIPTSPSYRAFPYTPSYRAIPTATSERAIPNTTPVRGFNSR